MPHRAAATVVFLGPVQDGLAERHHGGRKTDEGGGGRGEEVLEVDVVEIENRFYDVQQS